MDTEPPLGVPGTSRCIRRGQHRMFMAIRHPGCCAKVGKFRWRAYRSAANVQLLHNLEFQPEVLDHEDHDGHAHSQHNWADLPNRLYLLPPTDPNTPKRLSPLP